jgi:hypothetical protein
MVEEEAGEFGSDVDEFLWEVHNYTNEYIRFADTKAAFIAGASSALIGSLVASSLFDSCFRITLCQWSKTQWIGFAGLLFLAFSLALSVTATRPRLWNNARVGFIYWGSIVGHKTAGSFTRAFHDLSVRERSAALSNHLFVLARIAERKYAFVDRALYSGIAGGSLAGISLFMQHAWR